MAALLATAAGIGAASALIGGLGRAEELRFEADQTRENAELNRAIGMQERRAALKEYGRSLGAARAAGAASGVEVDGSVYDAMGEITSAYASALTNNRIETEYGYDQALATAESMEASAESAPLGGLFGAASGGLLATAYARS